MQHRCSTKEQAVAKFYNDRRPSPFAEGDSGVPLDKTAVTEANRHIMGATPVYRRAEIDRKIKTTAVQRQRQRDAGLGDFDSIEEYKNFIYGTRE
jgi:hypothetical protein